MKNKELMYSAFCAAQDAAEIATELREQLEALYGKDYPLTKKVDEIVASLDIINTLHFYLGGCGMVDREMFCEWISDEMEWGQCKDCANRTKTDGNGFHRCKLSRGQMSPEYGCYEWKPKVSE